MRLHEAARDNPNDPLPHFYTGQLLLDQGRAEEAARAYDMALRRDPTNAQAMLGMGRALWISGLLMMFSNLLFCVLALVGHSPLMLGLAVGTENLTSGIGLTVFVTYLSGLSSLAYTATQFALLSSFAAVGRTWLAAPSGYIAEGLGWVGFWLFTVVVAVLTPPVPLWPRSLMSMTTVAGPL